MNILPLSIVLFLLGLALGYLIRYLIVHYRSATAEKKAEELIKNAKIKQQEIYFRAKEEALKIIEQAKKEEEDRRRELKYLENRLEKRQSLFDKKLLDLEEKQKSLSEKAKKLEEAKEKIKELYSETVKKLEEISGLTKEEAKKYLLERVEETYKSEVLDRINKLVKYGSEEIEKKARQLITTAIERLSSSVATEKTKTIVNLPSDEMKGRIIGREGRNIKVLEELTGTEIIVDDTPNVIFISGFNPIRRQLTKIALEKLITDGRIQPARIERFIEEAKKELARDIKEAGEDALHQLGIVGVHPTLVQILGRLKYRSSYGQNVLKHSIEVANLSAMLAAELGADVAVAKKAGLFHDIGKALDQEVEGTHPEIGKRLGEKYGLAEEVIIPIATHHEDHPPTLEAIIVKVADAISSSRFGARKDTYENYLKRLEELENLAKSFSGVEKAYAIEAGREIRVFVRPEEIDDLKANKLAHDIASRIEEELKYPGEIKVTVIRENKIIEYAR
ncbi:ribonuclease Y [bacterium]|nr:ribonuclease Y [bacterium]